MVCMKDVASSRDSNNIYRKFKAPAFKIEHIKESKNQLNKYGWKNEDIATLIIRDTAYLENYLNQRTKYNKIDFSFHVEDIFNFKYWTTKFNENIVLAIFLTRLCAAAAHATRLDDNISQYLPRAY